MSFATNYYQVALNDTLANRTIESGNPIYVVGLIASAAGNVTIDIDDANGDDIMEIRVAAGETFSEEIPFVADKGMVLPSGAATTVVTVFYRKDG